MIACRQYALSILVLLLICKSVNAASPMTVGSITEAVQSNERMYDNIDAALIEKNQADGTPPRFTDGHTTVSRATESVIHYVGQDGMFRAETEFKAQNWGGSDTQYTRTRVFDKQVTKVLQSSDAKAPGIANVVNGQADDESVVRPHMLLLRMKRRIVPLSVYLRGADAIRAYPYGRFSENVELAVEYQGETDHKGLQCHLIWLTNTIKSTGAKDARFVLWLAEDRNYIPVRMESYDFKFSADVPICEGEVEDWKELKPGIWFPLKTNILRYDDVEAQKHRRKKLAGSWSYQFQEVSLEPAYDLAYFQELKIPDGSAVYKVDGKKITSSYRQGQPDVLPEQSGSWLPRWLLLWGNVAVVVVCGAFVLRKRLAK